MPGVRARQLVNGYCEPSKSTSSFISILALKVRWNATRPPDDGAKVLYSLVPSGEAPQPCANGFKIITQFVDVGLLRRSNGSEESNAGMSGFGNLLGFVVPM